MSTPYSYKDIVDFLKDFEKLKVTEEMTASEWCRINDIKTSTFHQWKNNPRVEAYRIELEKNPEAKAPDVRSKPKKGVKSTTREEEDELVQDVLKGKVTAAEVSRDSGHSYAKICYWVRRAVKAKGKPSHKRAYNKTHKNDKMTKANKPFEQQTHVNAPVAYDTDAIIDKQLLEAELYVCKLLLKKAGIQAPSFG